MDVKKNKLKDKVHSVRVTKDMDRLFQVVAKERGITVGKYLRDAGLILAEMSTDEKGMIELVKEKDRASFQKTFHMLFQETKDLVVNSSQSIFEQLTHRIERVEEFIEIFLYVYLYHTPEVKESLKEKARKSAKERKKKVMSVLDKPEESNKKA